MGKVSARIEARAPVGAAERLWFDLDRWPSFVDGFARVEKQEGGWPQAGGRLVWASTPRGRGRVVERVVSRQPGEGQVSEVDDPKVLGTQQVRFERTEDGVAVGLQLDYRLKDRTPLTPLLDLLFIRRAMRESVRRTLSRFKRELKSDVELLG